MTARAQWAQRRLAYTFKDDSLLDLALTHRSASKSNNERLEFLGDALLNFVVARRLYELWADASEGDLSRARASLVNKSSLASLGSELGVDEFIVLGAGEVRSGGAHRGAILADAVEALIGAVLLDGGAPAAEALIGRLLADRLASLPDAATLKDPKTRLQEWLQARGLGLPSYSVESVTGPDHEKTFLVACEIDEKNIRTAGQGASRRRAEQTAAAAMLAVLTRESR